MFVEPVLLANSHCSRCLNTYAEMQPSSQGALGLQKHKALVEGVQEEREPGGGSQCCSWVSAGSQSREQPSRPLEQGQEAAR